VAADQAVQAGDLHAGVSVGRVAVAPDDGGAVGAVGRVVSSAADRVREFMPPVIVLKSVPVAQVY
jgi:hypothetical protein